MKTSPKGAISPQSASDKIMSELSSKRTPVIKTATILTERSNSNRQLSGEFYQQLLADHQTRGVTNFNKMAKGKSQISVGQFHTAAAPKHAVHLKTQTTTS